VELAALNATCSAHEWASSAGGRCSGGERGGWKLCIGQRPRVLVGLGSSTEAPGSRDLAERAVGGVRRCPSIGTTLREGEGRRNRALRNDDDD
jgi:hypothetical protein